MKVKVIKSKYDDDKVVNYTIRSIDNTMMADNVSYDQLKMENSILRHKISVINRKVNRNSFWIFGLVCAGALAYSYFKEDSKEKDKEIKKIKIKIKGD